MLGKKEKKIQIDFEFDPRYRPAFQAGRSTGIEDGMRLSKDMYSSIIMNIKTILEECANQGNYKEPYLNKISECVGSEIRFATSNGDNNDKKFKT